MSGRGRGRNRTNHHNPSLPHNYPRHPPPPQQVDPNILLQNINYHLQNPNFNPLNPNFPHQNPNFSLPHLQQQFHNPNPNPNPNPNFTNTPNSSQGAVRPHKPQNKFPLLQKARTGNVAGVDPKEKIDAAVVAARRELVGGGKEHVSSWKVSQAALVILKVDSWDALGFKMMEIPSLRQLIFTEGKINAFIHCHVAAKKITSLFDLREDLCQNEGIEKFEELELGPFLLHPLVIHYFSVSSDVDEVYEITVEKIVSNLALYLYRKSRDVNIEEFLEFVAKKCKVTSKEKLGVRIHSLGMHIGMLCKARGAQYQVLKKIADAEKEKSSKQKSKRPLFSLQKKELDVRFSEITERVSSFASVNKDFGGKHMRFSSLSSDELDEMTDSELGEDIGGDSSMSKQGESSVQNKIGDKVSNCPYPSVAEEMLRLGLKGEMRESSSPHIIEPAKKRRRVKSQSNDKTVAQNSLLPCENIEIRGSKHPNDVDYSLDEDSIRMFITTWKDACQEHTAATVLEKMLHFYKMKKGQNVGQGDGEANGWRRP